MTSPKSRCSGCEPVTLASESSLGVLPGPTRSADGRHGGRRRRGDARRCRRADVSRSADALRVVSCLRRACGRSSRGRGCARWRIWVTAAMCRAWLSCRFPRRDRRCTIAAAGGELDRGGARVGGVAARGGEAERVAGVADEHGSHDRADTKDVGQRWSPTLSPRRGSGP